MDRSGFEYASHYCEENIARLLHRREPQAPRSVLFISNAARACPLWAQRGAAAANQPVVWDYHVVLLSESGRAAIWDLDSTLPFPCDALDYLGATFPLTGHLPEENEPCFRQVPEALFRETFASDRSHMRNADGSFRAPPPPWPPLQTPRASMTLPQFLDMKTPGLGQVFDLTGLRARLLRKRE
jgi:protein N-terminal glutamine amidohydrolase